MSLSDIFYQNTSVQTSAGCWLEYNMNYMIPNISVVSTQANTKYYHLFTLDSVAKPFRPTNSLIKFATLSSYDNSYTKNKTNYQPPRSINFNTSYPRTYCAGLNSDYKYYLTDAGSNLNVTVRYAQQSVYIISAYATGEYIQYQTNGAHGLTEGLTISISGFSNSALNVTTGTISATPTYNTFRIAKATSIIPKVTQNITGTLSAKTKDAMGNKIVAKFHQHHYLPSTCTIKIKGATEITKSGITIPSSGIVELYYNGSDWTTTAPTEPITFSEAQYVSEITIDATGSSNRFIGLIEFALLYLKDISSDVVSFSETKDSTFSSTDVVPVGLVTANNLNLKLTKFDPVSVKYLPYDPTSSLSKENIYLYKNIKLTPFIKVYDSAAPITAIGEPNKYYRVIGGSYYLSSYTIDTYGSVEINALDGSKYLMEKTAPDILLEKYPVTAVISALLDSVGFTNYNFNMLIDNSGVITDTSIPYLNSWWTDGSKTVWQCIQELCQDMQINAIFDSNNVLQFYTRDYMYDSNKSTAWNFYYEKDGANLANIITFDQKQIPSANQVKVKWQTPISSTYAGASTALWSSPITYLAAGGLMATIEANTSPENTLLLLSFATIDQYATTQTLYDFAGYILIDSEIIEYDAIQYQCSLENPINNQNVIFPWITSESELNQYRVLSKSGYADPLNPAETAYFKPTGRYRVKTRGALGTTPAKHNATGSLSDILANGWTSVSIPWKEK